MNAKRTLGILILVGLVAGPLAGCAESGEPESGNGSARPSSSGIFEPSSEAEAEREEAEQQAEHAQEEREEIESESESGYGYGY